MAVNDRPLTNPMVPLSRLLNSTLTVEDIVTTRLWSVPSSMLVEDAHKAMTNHRFDVGGVTPDPPRLYIHRNDLETAIGRGARTKPVEQYARSIPASECIERSLPVATLLELFERHERLFVLDGNAVRWVITHADLVAPAVSVAVLSYLTVIESGLKQLASKLSDEQIVARLPPKRQKRVLTVHEEREENNIGTTLRDCLFIDDWLTVTRRDSELLRRLGYRSGAALSEATSAFGKVRNDLAHGRDLLSDPEKPVLEVLERVRKIREFCASTWREVELSRPLWDAFAQTVISTRGRRQVTLTGVDAASKWPYTSPAFVLTAWNPGSVWVSAERNHAANRRLQESLEQRGATVTEVVGHSADRGWKEESFLIEGLQAAQVAELAVLFGQVAYFELDEDHIRVCDSATMEPVKSVQRWKRLKP